MVAPFKDFKKTRIAGFTLIELSIVLVIVGLVIGGVFVGRDMIRAAEIRSVISDIQRISTAINAFRGKYNCLPGDCAQATIYWGRADGGTDLTQNCAHPETDLDPLNPTATCNGDGSGIIGDGTSQNLEDFRVWQHLSNAGLIQGQYTGVGGALAYGWRAATLGVNIPASKITGVGYFTQYAELAYYGVPPQWSGVGSAQLEEQMYVGTQTFLTPPWNPAFTPAEALDIDLKIDDGLPGTGLVFGLYTAVLPACVTTADTQTSRYDNSQKAVACTMLINVLP
jgi:prepilin-type N-terminal cleavage/methylation domain-containing protein